ncbi:MAG: glycosyltransferase family 4 protein [Thermoflexales bacterium]|nr:glycosyltransferase family 4 protein [Thermoflexales bacterium]
MKVAVNGWFLAPDLITTGSGQYAAKLLAALSEVAPEIRFEIIAPRRRGDWDKVYFEQVTFPREARQVGADLAFVPYWAPPLHSEVPVVVTVHDVIPIALPAYRGGPLQRAYASLVRAATQNAAAVLTDSEFSRQDILRLIRLPAERVSVVPLAVDADFKPTVSLERWQAVAERYALPESYVLYVGGYDPRKNIETLLQVYVWCGESIGEEYPLVLNTHPDTLVTADNGERMTIAQMADALEVREYLRFIGPIAEADKPVVYAGARAFIYTSTYEGFGLPLLEAMACGVPVVGSSAASLPEVAGNAAMLVDPKDARRMAGALIAACIEDDLRERLRQRGLLRAAQFTWQRTALDTLAVFRRVLN